MGSQVGSPFCMKGRESNGRQGYKQNNDPQG